MTDIAVTIDSINYDMQAYDSGASPYDSYTIISQWNNMDIQRHDTLTEPNGRAYQVVNDPEQFYNGQTEMKASRLLTS